MTLIEPAETCWRCHPGSACVSLGQLCGEGLYSRRGARRRLFYAQCQLSHDRGRQDGGPEAAAKRSLLAGGEAALVWCRLCRSGLQAVPHGQAGPRSPFLSTGLKPSRTI
eukprot:scaffold40872_cov35-Prasinocladus_malaysianus.AAC.1